MLPETEKKNYALRRSRRRVRRIHHENRMVWQSSGVFVHQQHHRAVADEAQWEKMFKNRIKEIAHN